MCALQHLWLIVAIFTRHLMSDSAGAAHRSQSRLEQDPVQTLQIFGASNLWWVGKPACGERRLTSSPMEIGHVCRQGSLVSHFLLLVIMHQGGWFSLCLTEGEEETGKAEGGQTWEAEVQLPELPGLVRQDARLPVSQPDTFESLICSQKAGAGLGGA